METLDEKHDASAIVAATELFDDRSTRRCDVPDRRAQVDRCV